MLLVHGAWGRMGREVLSLVRQTDDVTLGGVLELRDVQPVSGPVGAEDATILGQVPQNEGRATVVVDFSHPQGLARLIAAMAGSGVPLVSGTTGIGAKERALLKGYSKETAVLYDENMSYGVSAVRALVEAAVPLLGDYDVEIVETHHADKQDHPSGTALALSRLISPEAKPISGRGDGRRGPVHIHSLRLGGIPGEHHVLFANHEEVVTLSHRAISRQVFARGAIRAARFISSKERGLFRMEDILGDTS